MIAPGRDGSAGSVLERLARRGPPPRAGERCELCAAPVAAEHPHVVDLRTGALRCACRPCGVLFDAPGGGSGGFRTVPDRVVPVATTTAVARRWDDLGVPVSIAFVVHESASGRVVARYPGPGGATEAEIPAEAWRALVADLPGLPAITHDVEALLVRRVDGAIDAWIVPIDRCFALAGRLRSVWQGFDGGAPAREMVADEFARLAASPRPGRDPGVR